MEHTTSNLQSWIRLAKLETPKRTVALVERFGSPDAVFDAKPRDLMTVEGASQRLADKLRDAATQSVDQEIEALEKAGARMITYRDPDYPANLRQIYDPPLVLFVKGELKEEDRFAVGIVGTRRPSEYGKSVAFKISRELAARGLCIVSGAARGIDTVAHTGALQTGRTIAVLGCGVDVAYPSENRGLLNKIAENGALVSEYVPGTQPDAWRFPVRNRLVSGLSLGILVVESRSIGGAMITAGIAGEQGRDVWAIPGAMDNVTSEGPHGLIRDGAKLVQKAEDILEDLGLTIEESPPRPSLPDNLTPEQTAIIQALDLHPKHMDDIIGECGLTPSTAGSALTLLEMQGLVRRVPGNSYVRVM